MKPKTILITGASRGIGRAAAILAAQRGWSVIVNYLHNDVAAQRVVDMVKTLGAKSIKIQGDVAREDDVIRVSKKPPRSALWMGSSLTRVSSAHPFHL